MESSWWLLMAWPLESSWWLLMAWPLGPGTKYQGPGSIKISSYQHRKSHCGDKTIWRSSYLHNGISYAGKTASLCPGTCLMPGYLQQSWWHSPAGINHECPRNVNLYIMAIELCSLPKWGWKYIDCIGSNVVICYVSKRCFALWQA